MTLRDRGSFSERKSRGITRKTAWFISTKIIPQPLTNVNEWHRIYMIKVQLNQAI